MEWPCRTAAAYPTEGIFTFSVSFFRIFCCVVTFLFSVCGCEPFDRMTDSILTFFDSVFFYQKRVDICQQTDIYLNLIPLWYKTSHCEHLLQRISSNPESRSYEGQAERCIMIRMKLLSAAAMVFWRKTMGHLTSCTGMHILTHCCMYEISPNPLYFEHSQMAPIVT